MTDSLHVLFSDEGHPVAIRKSSKEPFDDAVEYVRKSDYADLIAACDEALNWADANARAFPIETAPTDKWIEVWCSVNKIWFPVFVFPEWIPGSTLTHWKPTPPPPSNPPLPAPLERLGEVLRKVKGVE